MAPIMVVLASPLVLGQAVPKHKLILALVALAGMVLVSGILTDSIYGPRGILLGLGAAFFYAHKCFYKILVIIIHHFF
jgi:drug/metabolite transporter (DMT)-like permease